MNERYVPLLAVDGGGTKCAAVLADAAGNPLGAGRAGACNYHGAGAEGALRELTAALRAAVADARAREREGKPAVRPGEDGCVIAECAVFAMAGLDTDRDADVLTAIVREALRAAGIRVRHLLVENDGLAALLGAAGGRPGVLVVSGTGSIVYGVDGRDRHARAGGWGHRVGDEGSGYWIGREALAAVLRAHDGRGDATALTEVLLAHLGVERPEDLFDWVYSEAYSVEGVSALAPLVDRTAAGGDRVARGILRAAAGELCFAVESVANALDLGSEPFAILLQGGVLRHGSMVRRLLIRRLRRRWPRAEIKASEGEPIAAVIARGLSVLHSAAGGIPPCRDERKEG